MTENLNETLLQQILTLPSNLRAELIDKLIESLNVPIQKEIDELWAEEAERRTEEINSGEVEAIPGDKVFKKIRSRFKK
jgi:putative addiction module component (TIGR02574 family)